MRIGRCGNKGMTLIEVLVAGVVSTIVAGAMFVVWKSYDDRIQASSTDGTLQMQCSEAIGQVGRYARNAHRIFEQYYVNANDSCRTDSCHATDSLFFYNRSGAPFAAVMLRNDTLYQYDTSAGALVGGAFTTGSGVVLVDTSSSFDLNGCRNGVRAHLTFKRIDGDTVELYTPGPEVIRCRN